MNIRITGCVLAAKILQTVKNGCMGWAIRAKSYKLHNALKYSTE